MALLLLLRPRTSTRASAGRRRRPGGSKGAGSLTQTVILSESEESKYRGATSGEGDTKCRASASGGCGSIDLRSRKQILRLRLRMTKWEQLFEVFRPAGPASRSPAPRRPAKNLRPTAGCCSKSKGEKSANECNAKALPRFPARACGASAPAGNAQFFANLREAGLRFGGSERAGTDP